MMPGPRVAQTKSGIFFFFIFFLPLRLLLLSLLSVFSSSSSVVTLVPRSMSSFSPSPSPSSQSGRLSNAFSTSSAKVELWPSTVTIGLMPLKARLSDEMRSLNSSAVFPFADFDSTATAVSSHDVSIARVVRERFFILHGVPPVAAVRVRMELRMCQMSDWRVMRERHRGENIRSCSVT